MPGPETPSGLGKAGHRGWPEAVLAGEGGVSADSLSSVNLHKATDGFWSFISKDTQEMKTSLSTGRTSPAGSVP